MTFNWTFYLIMIGSLLVLALIFRLLKKYNYNLLLKIGKILFILYYYAFKTAFGYIIVIVLFIFSPILIFYISIELFRISNFIFYIFIHNKYASSYLALTMILIILAYFPFVIKRILMIFRKKSEVEIFTFWIEKARFKLCLFLLSFLLVLLSSIESFTNRELLVNSTWNTIKPVVLQSIVTLIAFDRFIKLYNEEKLKIVNDFKNGVVKVKDWFRPPNNINL